jgi:putative acetyltransferase
MDIRIMHPDEFEEMRELSVAAFGDDPQIRHLLDVMHDSWGWQDELCFVAEREGELVGQVLYSHAWVDAPDRLVDVLLLSPIGVRPDLQRSGVGKQLMRQSLEVVANRDEPMVFLEGHPSYYPQFGFVPASGLGFTAASTRIPDAAFMVHLLPRYDPSITGAVVYPDAFWRTDTVGLR